MCLLLAEVAWHIGGSLSPGSVWPLLVTQVDGRLQPVLQKPQQQVLWCPIHPEPTDLHTAVQQHPLFFDSSLPRPLRVEVCEGDVLYLPAMWWHYVQQEGDDRDGWCVAVNYW